MKHKRVLFSFGIAVAITHSLCVLPVYSQGKMKPAPPKTVAEKTTPQSAPAAPPTIQTPVVAPVPFKIAVADLSALDMGNADAVSAAKILLQKAAEEKGALIVCDKNTLLFTSPNVEIVDISDAVKAIIAANPKPTAATPAAQQEKDKQRESNKAALRAVRKLVSAVKSGVSYQSYGDRMANAQAEVDEALLDVQDGEFKNKIRAAMAAYADASELWGTAFRVDYASIYLKSIEKLIERYQLKFQYDSYKLGRFDKVFQNGVTKLVYVSAPLSKIWAQAETEFLEAEKLVAE